METDANIFKSFKHFGVIKYVVQCITLFYFFFQYLLFAKFFSVIKRGIFLHLELSPFLVIWMFVGCSATECKGKRHNAY